MRRLLLALMLVPSSAWADIDCAKVITVPMIVAACGANAPAVAAYGPLRVWPDEEREGYDGVVCQRIVGWRNSQILFTVRRLPSPADAESHTGDRIDRIARQAYLGGSSGYSPPEAAKKDGITFTSWRGPGPGGTVVFSTADLAVEVTSRRRETGGSAAPLICTADRLGSLARRISSKLK